MAHTVELDIAGRTLRLETGRVAKQADGSIWATYGDTIVLATAVASQTAKPGVDFLPLTVDYQEKAYAAGKIPGGYFKREGRPSEKEVLTSRLIDRPLRPLFPDGYYYETQVIASVLSADKTGSSDVIGITAASAALAVSDIPFNGPVAGVKIGRVECRRPVYREPRSRYVGEERSPSRRGRDRRRGDDGRSGRERIARSHDAPSDRVGPWRN